ncbi:hypothetical protein ACIBG8_33310 [Nonomuraea sp. NPDC050556]|uniref:hypothetical protein n=1 Tax=Nonomuraea sp. NPDC050556 TaxID=3364369 RepID=UPI0037B1E95E
MRATVIVVATLLLLTGCGAGQGAAPGASLPRNEGGNADLRGMHVRNVYIAQGQLHAVLINGAQGPDRLRQITMQGATATLAGPVELLPDTPVGSDKPLASVAGLPTPAPGYVPATFTFDEAGTATIQVPIK